MLLVSLCHFGAVPRLARVFRALTHMNAHSIDQKVVIDSTEDAAPRDAAAGTGRNLFSFWW